MVAELESKRDDSPTEQLRINPARRVVLVKLENGGEVRLESGDSGQWLQFDGECLDMLPYCRAQCCALTGTVVDEESQEKLAQAYGEKTAEVLLDFHSSREWIVMKRQADGRCIALDRETCKCTIYEHRPNTCSAFHCTKGSGMRGWPLGNAVTRQWTP